jgi:hypothetical protein
MSILLNDNLNISAAKPTDSRYGPYASTAAALAAIPSFQRYRGLVIGVVDTTLREYWFKDGVLDSDLEEKLSEGGGSGNGYTGSQGDIGYTGSQGDRGADGNSVTIVGSVAASADLIPNYLGAIGDGIVAQDTGILWVWDGQIWISVGQFVGYTGSQGDIGFTGSAGIDGAVGFTGSSGDVGFTGSSGDIGFTGSSGDVGFTGSAGIDGAVGFTGSSGEIGFTGSAGVDGAVGFTGSAGQDGVIGRDGYTGSQGDIGYTGSAVEGLVSDGVSSITIQSGYTLVFPDGSGQLSAAPRMYTNADAANGLSLSDLKPGDYYYDDINAAIYICYDTGLGYFDILDLTVRA